MSQLCINCGNEIPAKLLQILPGAKHVCNAPILLKLLVIALWLVKPIIMSCK